MFANPIRLEEWIALNAAPVAPADDSHDSGEHGSGDAESPHAAHNDTAKDGDQDGNAQEGAGTEVNTLGDLLRALLPSGNHDIFAPSDIHVPYPPPPHDVFAIYELRISEVQDGMYENMKQVLDSIKSGVQDVSILNSLLTLESQPWGGLSAPPELVQAISVDFQYDPGSSPDSITVRLSFSGDSLAKFAGQTFGLSFMYHANETYSLDAPISLTIDKAGSPPAVIPDGSGPAITFEPPPFQSHDPGLGDFPSINLSSTAGIAWPEKLEWEDPGFESPSELVLGDIADLPEPDELLLAMSEAKRQFGRLENALAHLQDASVLRIDGLDHSSLDSITGAMGHGNDMLDALNREIGVLSAISKHFSQIDPDMRDGIMQEGIEDGAERALLTSGEAGILATGLEAMAHALHEGEGGGEDASLEDIFDQAVEDAAREAAIEAQRQDRADVEADVFRARHGATDKRF